MTTREARDFMSRQETLLTKEMEEETRSYQQKLDMSINELIQQGLVITRLKVIQVDLIYGCRNVTFTMLDRVKHKVAKEDMVSVYARNCFTKGNTKLSDMEMISSGYVTQHEGNEIVVSFPETCIESYSFTVEKAAMKGTKTTEYLIFGDATGITNKINMEAIHSYKKNECPRVSYASRELLFCSNQDILSFKENNKLRPDQYKNVELQWTNQRLDSNQKEAIVFSLDTNNPVCIIHGPPGTGKTTTLCEIILQLVLNKKQKVLVCSQSNQAVDNILSRLVDRQAELKCLRIGNPSRIDRALYPLTIEKRSEDQVNKMKAELEECQDMERLKEMLNKIKSVKYKVMDKFMKESNCIFSTLTTATSRLGRSPLLGSHRDEMKEKREAFENDVVEANKSGVDMVEWEDYHFKFENEPRRIFDVVIIDECSQALEVACWGPIMMAKRVIIAGDHMQLPATIMCNEIKPELEVSLMERMVRKFETHEDRVVRMLTMQYRMNKLIMNVVSKPLYGGRLQAHSSVSNIMLSDLNKKMKDKDFPSIMLITTRGMTDAEDTKTSNGSTQNIKEADLVLTYCQELVSKWKFNPKSITIITPYNSQIDLIRSKLYYQSNSNSQLLKNIGVYSIDGFQGQENEVIILSLVRSNDMFQIGFLSEKRRLNVAITRAKRQLVLIGDSSTLGIDPFIKEVIKYVRLVGQERNAHDFSKMPIGQLQSEVYMEQILDRLPF